MDACNTEAEVYLILGTHPLVAQCLFIAPSKDYIEMEYYANDNLEKYMKNKRNITRSETERWAL
jgi:hypothetical protein